MSIPFTWVYLIHDEHTGLYKIGKSDNPHARLKQLMSPPGGTILAAPQEYTIYEAWLVPEKCESELHKYYAEYRVRGEWFELEYEEIEEIEDRFAAYQTLWGGKSRHEINAFYIGRELAELRLCCQFLAQRLAFVSRYFSLYRREPTRYLTHKQLTDGEIDF